MKAKKLCKIVLFLIILTLYSSVIYAATWYDGMDLTGINPTELAKYSDEENLYRNNRTLWEQYDSIAKAANNTNYQKNRENTPAYKKVLSSFALNNLNDLSVSASLTSTLEDDKKTLDTTLLGSLSKNQYPQTISAHGGELYQYKTEEEFLNSPTATIAAKSSYMKESGKPWYSWNSSVTPEAVSKMQLDQYSSYEDYLAAAKAGKVSLTNTGLTAQELYGLLGDEYDEIPFLPQGSYLKFDYTNTAAKFSKTPSKSTTKSTKTSSTKSKNKSSKASTNKSSNSTKKDTGTNKPTTVTSSAITPSKSTSDDSTDLTRAGWANSDPVIMITDENLSTVVAAGNTVSQEAVGENILGYDNGKFFFKPLKYNMMSYDEKKDFMKTTLNAIVNSKMRSVAKTKAYNFISERDGDMAAAIKLVADETTADLYGAKALLSGVLDKIGVVMGVISIMIFALMGLTMVMDMAYIVIPGIRLFLDRSEGKKRPFLVSTEAWKSVQESERGNTSAGALSIYIKNRVIMLLILSVMLMLIVTGKLYDLMGWIVDSFSGIFLA